MYTGNVKFVIYIYFVLLWSILTGPPWSGVDIANDGTTKHSPIHFESLHWNSTSWSGLHFAATKPIFSAVHEMIIIFNTNIVRVQVIWTEEKYYRVNWGRVYVYNVASERSCPRRRSPKTNFEKTIFQRRNI